MRPHLIGSLAILLSIKLVLHAAAAPDKLAADEKPAPAPAEKSAPAPDWRALFQMHYVNRVAAFREQNLVYQNVVLVGDSITEGFDVKTYFPGRRIVNRGIGADVIGNELPPEDKRGVLKRMDESFFNCAATDVFLLIGINDLGASHSSEAVAAGYRQILEQVKSKAPLIRLHVQSLLPTRDTYAKHNPAINDVNHRLQKLAAEFGYDYIDLHSLMSDDQGELKKEFTSDGLHINSGAYNIWKAEIERKLGWQ
jgi:lysophospholipase L1-like esterase